MCNRLLFGLLVLVFCLACDSEKTPVAPSSPTDPNREMAALLDSLARIANPMDNYHLNKKRAELWQQQANAATDPNQKLVYQFQMCNELLNAGQLEVAIRSLEGLRQQFQQAGVGVTDQTKALYELLAIAYLRLGEQQNCTGTYAASACILPLKEEAFHQLESGSRNAIAVYEQILEAYPEDYQSQWLLNLAYMTLGEYPQQVPPKWRLPEQTFQSEQRDFVGFKNIAPQLGIDVKGLSGGVCMDDFNADGLLDFFVTSYGYQDPVHLFINQGNGRFVDKAPEADLEGITGGLNTLHADYNNDGHLDILILRGGWLGKGGNQPNSLLQNNGDGTFTDVTKQAGLLSFHPSQTAAWGDFNNDGWIDLFIGNESSNQGGKTLVHPCELYLNKKDGTFQEVASLLGVNLVGFVKGCAWGDINNDGWIDLYVSNLNGPNALYINKKNPDTGDRSFLNIAASAGVEEPKQSFPTWFWDYDNDGWEDIFVSGYDLARLNEVGYEVGAEYLSKTPKGELPRIYRNQGDGTFKNVTNRLQLDKIMYSMGANFGDLDMDGFLDFYVGTGAPDFRSVVPNRMFRNLDGQQFKEVTMSGFGHIQKGHGIAFGDWDNDGDEDLYAVMGGAFQGDFAQNVLFQNPTTEQNWVTLKLIGQQANRAAIGARIRLLVADKEGKTWQLCRTVSTGGSFGASSLQQEIGLGKATQIQRVEIRWPVGAGQVQVIEGLRPNVRYEITQGRAQAGELDQSPISFQ